MGNVPAPTARNPNRLPPERLTTLTPPRAPLFPLELMRPLDFTVYRKVVRRLENGVVERHDEVTGVSVPDVVRTAILERADLAWIRVCDAPYRCGVFYAPPRNAFYVHYGYRQTLTVGHGRVMIFSGGGSRLYDGSDGCE
jgi:hypothetical protein